MAVPAGRVWVRRPRHSACWVTSTARNPRYAASSRWPQGYRISLGHQVKHRLYTEASYVGAGGQWSFSGIANFPRTSKLPCKSRGLPATSIWQSRYLEHTKTYMPPATGVPVYFQPGPGEKHLFYMWRRLALPLTFPHIFPWDCR